MLSDLRHAARRLRTAPANSLAAVLTLGLMLGAGAAIFALVDRALLTPPPVTAPETLVLAGERATHHPVSPPGPIDAITFQQWRAASDAAQLEAWDPQNVTVSGLGLPARLSATAVTPGFFDLLGVPPRIGRSFAPADRDAVIVSHAFWRDTLLADPNPLGRAVVIGGRPHLVIGVLPDKFHFDLNASDLWRPLTLGPEPVRVLGRLQPRVTPAALAARLDAVREHAPADLATAVVPLRDAIEGPARATLPLLAAAAALAALLASANVAGLVLLRFADRLPELGVALALGASRRQLVRPLAIEVLLLAMLAASAGVIVALWATPVAGTLAADALRVQTSDLGFGWPGGAAIIGVALVIGLACAVPPALSAVAAARGTRLERRTLTPPPTHLLMRRALVTAQLAVAFVLLSTLLGVGRSLQHLIAVDPGFSGSGVLTARLSLPPSPYGTADEVREFYRTLDTRLAAAFGRSGIALVDELPLTGDGGRVRVGRHRATPHDAVARTAGPSYFELMQIPVVRGRTFQARDHADAPLRVVVSHALATRLGDDLPLIGSLLWLDGAERPAEVIGVVGDVKHRSLDESTLPTIYFDALQAPSRSVHVLLKHALTDADALALLREEVTRLDAELPVYAARSLEAYIDASPGVASRRVIAGVFSAFTGLALVLAGVGVFGVVAHEVSRRRLELALRAALGAPPAVLRRHVLQQALVLLAPGLTAGLALWAAAARTLRSLAYDAGTFDPWVVPIAIGALAVLAVGAAAWPARRASLIDPVAALRGI